MNRLNCFKGPGGKPCVYSAGVIRMLLRFSCSSLCLFIWAFIARIVF